jgi:hypothetical protein
MLEHRLRVFENRGLSGICELKREKLSGVCRKLSNVELHNLYLWPIFTMMIKSRIRWAGHEESMGEK